MRQKRGTPGHQTLLEILIDGRVAAGLTQTELAEKLCVRQSYVSNYETGERRLDVIEFIIACDAIGLDPEGVVEQVAEVVRKSPPKIIGGKAQGRPNAAQGRKGPRQRKAD